MELHLKLYATVSGTTCLDEPFSEEVEFELYQPKNDNYYGTGYYMGTKTYSERYPKPMVGLCDVRYEGTTDIKILADRYIKQTYGKNAKEVTMRYTKENEVKE